MTKYRLTRDSTLAIKNSIYFLSFIIYSGAAISRHHIQNKEHGFKVLGSTAFTSVDVAYIGLDRTSCNLGNLHLPILCL
ncbi:hypothetical protein X801_00280, partial [Opisthorchis viverrini]